MTYRFDYDQQSGAFYIRVREGEYSETIPLVEIGFGAGVDVDAEGSVLGFEFLSLEEFAEVTDREAGGLEIPERIENMEAFIASRKREPAVHRWDSGSQPTS